MASTGAERPNGPRQIGGRRRSSRVGLRRPCASNGHHCRKYPIAAERHAPAGRVDVEDPPWQDLSFNVPGQAAREQADPELAAQKERSRVGSFLARAFDVKTDERAWRVGAGGEETVCAKLEKLVIHGWHVLHAVPVGDRGSDIDHVVIEHGGVYTVNTKTHPGGKVWVGKRQVRVSGHATNYLRN
jgi:hypothetical protein